ncbi:MAG: DUF3108 domain-containing protein [Gammaproteobacteria bacterium]|jgi:hypothetical protein
MDCPAVNDIEIPTGVVPYPFVVFLPARPSGAHWLLWFVLFYLGLWHGPSAIAEPATFTAKYDVSKGIMAVGSTVRILRHHGNGRYVFESVTKPGGIARLFTSGKVVERSLWEWQNDKIVPREYVYVNSGDQKRNVKLIFDWDENEVTNIINGDPWTMELESDTLDKLIYQLAIMYDLEEGHKNLVYRVADGGTMKTYNMKIEGEERLVMELGVFNTVKVVRKTKNREITMWCARELRYLPVKIQQRRPDDSAVTARLVEISGIPMQDGNNSADQPTPQPSKD